MPAQQTSPLSNLSAKIELHDVSTISGTPEYTTLLRKGLLFLSTPTELATSADKNTLRNVYNMKTLVTTVLPKYRHYVHDGGQPGSYSTELFAIEEVFGLNLCRLNLRYGKYADSIGSGLSFRSLKQLQNGASKKEKVDPKVIRMAEDLVWNRDSIDDSFLLLVTAAPLIARLFNDVLCKADMYPLVICGDRAMRDNTLLMFLLLLMLDIPFPAIESAYLRATEGLPLKLGDDTDVHLAQRLQRAAWPQNRTRWAAELRRRLETKYGSISAYFSSMGVTEATVSCIKEILLAPEKEVLLDVT